MHQKKADQRQNEYGNPLRKSALVDSGHGIWHCRYAITLPRDAVGWSLPEAYRQVDTAQRLRVRGCPQDPGGDNDRPLLV